MAVTFLDSSHKHYDSLQSIPNAIKWVDSYFSLPHLSSAISRILIKHRVDKLFGIILIHRHFSLQSTEQLVDIKQDSASSSNGPNLDHVVARSWRFVLEGLAAYEFTYLLGIDGTSSDLGNHLRFVDELREFLKATKLEAKLGITLLRNQSSTGSPVHGFPSIQPR